MKWLRRSSAVLLILFGAVTLLASIPVKGAVSSDLALGIDNLYWGMSPEEAERAYPALALPRDKGLPAMTGSQEFRYAGCTGALSLHFYQRHLNWIRFEQVKDSSPCRERIERELHSQYGPGYNPFPPNTDAIEMRSRITKIYYSHWVNSFGDWIIVDLRELTDSSGERFAAMLAGDANRRRATCQSVRVEFIPDHNLDRVIAPTFMPIVPDLNCEYPYLAWLASQQGRIVVQLRVLADGTVANPAFVTDNSKNTRLLADAAIEIAREKLLFTPAIKDGIAVEGDGRLLFEFKIENPFQGGRP
jgi:hypothetical protein